MNINEKSNFVTLMTGISEVYGKKLSSQLLDIYWAALVSFSFEQIKTALQRHLLSPDTGQFMPKPADVVRCLNGDSETQAMRAWSLVSRATYEIGPYKSVVFDDPIIHVVIEEMGGWVQLCRITENEMPFRAREFEKRYSSYVIQRISNYPKQLCGIIEQHNMSFGHSNNSFVLIGDKTKAQQVYAAGNKYLRNYSEITSTQLLSNLSKEGESNHE